MTPSNYMELGIRAAGISLVTYTLVGQVVKVGIRIAVKRLTNSRRLSKGKEELLRWLVRTTCVLVGAALGSIPSVWPSWMSEPIWGVLMGTIAGSFAPVIHHAVSAALGDRIKRLVGGASVTRNG